MPAKKNGRKRSRDDSDRPKGPPKKRIKKALPNTDESQYVRRSKRVHKKPTEFWKANTSNDEESDNNDSDVSNDTNITYEVPIKRTTSNRGRKQKQTQSQHPKRSKSNNNRSRNNQRNKNKIMSEQEQKRKSKRPTDDSDLEEDEDEDQNEDISEDESLSQDIKENHNSSNVSQRRMNQNAAIMISPHRKQRIDDLPGIEDIDLSGDDIKKLIKEHGMFRKSHQEMLNKLESEYEEVYKNGQKSRQELNESIKAINDHHKEIKINTDKMYKEIMDRFKKSEQGDDDDEKSEENHYKVLYETSMKKINALNNDMMNLRNDLRIKCEEMLELNKKHEIEKTEIEEQRKRENMELQQQHKRDITDLELKLKCVETEYSEYKEGIVGKFKINENNQNLMIENLKRENEALCNELSEYRGRERTATPNSAILSPAITTNTNINSNYNYNNHIRDSPLMERTRNELLKISNFKDLENKIINLQHEINGYKNKLNGKKELIKEFETLLNENQNELKKCEIEKKNIIYKLNDHKKMIDLYQVLTSTKIEKKSNNDKDEEQENDNNFASNTRKDQFLCRTMNKLFDNNKMLEYYLGLGPMDDNQNSKEIFLDYQLISRHNIKFQDNRLEEDEMTFHSNQAPLWLKGLLQEMFVNK